MQSACALQMIAVHSQSNLSAACPPDFDVVRAGYSFFLVPFLLNTNCSRNRARCTHYSTDVPYEYVSTSAFTGPRTRRTWGRAALARASRCGRSGHACRRCTCLRSWSAGLARSASSGSVRAASGSPLRQRRATRTRQRWRARVRPHSSSSRRMSSRSSCPAVRSVCARVRVSSQRSDHKRANSS